MMTYLFTLFACRYVGHHHAVVTGGAGFIGSHLVKRLLRDGSKVTVIDNCSSGNADAVPESATFIRGDIREPDILEKAVTREHDIVFHLASRKAVNDENPREQFEANTSATQDVIEAVIDSDIPEFVFTSSSTVYGEAPRPTPEDHAPLEPISHYGASKLASEAILSTAAHTEGVSVCNVRFANIIGPRLRGAVIPDFIEKLRTTPDRLTILGNGRQEKSYMHVTDCIDAMLYVREHATDPMATYNLGTAETTSVDAIAEIVADEMDLDPEFEYTGGERGWKGDVPKMQLSIEKLRSIGWEPDLESDAAVRRSARELLEEMG